MAIVRSIMGRPSSPFGASTGWDSAGHPHKLVGRLGLGMDFDAYLNSSRHDTRGPQQNLPLRALTISSATSINLVDRDRASLDEKSAWDWELGKEYI